MKHFLLYLSKSVLLGLIIAGLLILVLPELRQRVESMVFKAEIELAPKLSFSDAASRAAPAVVNIYTRRFQQSSLTTGSQLAAQGLGSGVIMSTQGYILTNYHVVANADQIIIALQDGRIFSAQLVGSDILTDLVVLKIAAENLPVIPQSSDVTAQVGDVVLAIGNPYNVGQTITQGIIGATGRVSMSATHRQDFLQTDAAINRGNSGGALVNTRGELVGINTSAFELKEGQDPYGISFAIPYQLAMKIMDSLIREGKVTRGYLGLDGVEISPVLAQKWKLGNIRGVIVKNTDPNGPAAMAGIQANDIVIKVGDTAISGVKQAMDIVAETPPESTLALTILRDGQPLVLSVLIQELELDIGERR